jgi:hypothetical protein
MPQPGERNAGRVVGVQSVAEKGVDICVNVIFIMYAHKKSMTFTMPIFMEL